MLLQMEAFTFILEGELFATGKRCISASGNEYISAAKMRKGEESSIRFFCIFFVI